MYNRDKDMVDELAEYIKRNMRKGYTRESLRWALVNQKYSRIQIENALKKVDMDMAKEVPSVKAFQAEKPIIKHEFILQEPKKTSFWEKIFG
jgi:hypothetical protein